MRQNYLGAKSLGLTEQQAIDIMVVGKGSEYRKRGLSKDDLNSILDGRYYRYEPSESAIDEVYDKFPERVEAYERALKETPEREDFVEQ